MADLSARVACGGDLSLSWWPPKVAGQTEIARVLVGCAEASLERHPQVAEALLLQDLAALTLARDLRDLRLAQRSDAIVRDYLEEPRR